MSVLLKCSDVGISNEMFIIELQVCVFHPLKPMLSQGSIVSKENESVSSKLLGKLRQDHRGMYELAIGNHVLEGTLETLTKPLLVMEPTGDVEPFMEVETLRSNVCQVRGVVREKLIFKTRPKIVVGAMESDSELGASSCERERVRT